MSLNEAAGLLTLVVVLMCLFGAVIVLFSDRWND